MAAKGMALSTMEFIKQRDHAFRSDSNGQPTNPWVERGSSTLARLERAAYQVGQGIRASRGQQRLQTLGLERDPGQRPAVLRLDRVCVEARADQFDVGALFEVWTRVYRQGHLD